MEPADLRKRVLRALDEARRHAAAHREEAERAGQAFDRLQPEIAALWRQVANVLKVEGHPYTINTPAGSVRFASERWPESFVEVTLDTTRRPVAVVGRTVFARGREGIDREAVVAEAAELATVEAERWVEFLARELEPFLER